MVQSKKKKTEPKPKPERSRSDLKALCERFSAVVAMLSTSTVSHCKADLKALIEQLEILADSSEGPC